MRALYLATSLAAGALVMPTPAAAITAEDEAAVSASSQSSANAADVTQGLDYPETKTVDVADEQFGKVIADPYRWLEDDVRVNDEVADWVKAQNAVTDEYLDSITGRDALADKMKKLFDYERFGLPRKSGGKYFFSKNDGLQNQSVLYVRDKLDAEERVLIDPNEWAKDGATALAGWVPSGDGKRLLYSVQDGGSDWRTVKVLDVATGKPLDDTIEWVKFSGLSWVGNDAFIYSRFPEPKEGAAFQSLNLNQAVYYHKLGTPQSADIPVYSTPDRPELNHSAELTHDDQWMVITSSSGTDEKYDIHVAQVGKGRWNAVPLVTGFENEWQLIDGIGDTLYFVTNKDAPKLKVVKVDMANPRMKRVPCEGELAQATACTAPEYVFTDVIPERAETLSQASIVGDRIILSYMQDAKSLAEMTDLDGKPVSRINLADIGTASGFGGKPGDAETFYSFASFTQPGAVYRFNTTTGVSEEFAKPDLSFDAEDFVTEQRFYTSKDGTKIPMFVVHRKDLDLSEGAPTLLYGYGGFNISLTPGFSATRMAWIQSGGVYAQASLRGGGEYGKPWHDAGRLQNKQNVFDDFAAAGEYLIAEGISAPGKLAIEGRSNGGLLVGASVNQRPDLFAAGHAAVGVMDMLRFDRFTAGRYWVDDYGYPNKEADFKKLLSYSPYHNIKDGTDYPAVIVSTADTDDRVVPGHSFKYISALQAADTGDKPKIIRIESRAGHGSGKPTDKLIEEYSDIYAFLAKHTGLELTGDE